MSHDLHPFHITDVAIYCPPRMAGSRALLATMTVEIGPVTLSGCRLLRPYVGGSAYLTLPGQSRSVRAAIRSPRLAADLNAAAVKAFAAAGGSLKARLDFSTILENADD
ncbi:hypothetical protein [Pseudoroseomonas sp. WGS1072]|uniref:hypothetical protein n=1 Tax=Roseomonas sp. WGS1072 TaxID=3366816 RepID=UPI003BF3960B